MRNALAEARYYYLQVTQANADLTRLKRRSRELEALVRRIEDYGRNIDVVVDGSVPPSVHVSINYFLRLLGGDDIVTFGSEAVPSIAASSFVLRTPYSTRRDPETGALIQVPNQLESYPGGNVLGFLAWLKPRPMHGPVGDLPSRTPPNGTH